jgi:DNA processing protein
MTQQLLQQIALTMLTDVGDLTAKKLIAYCGGVEAVFSESVNSLRKIPNISSKVIQSIKNQKVFAEAEKEIRFIEKNNINPLFYLDNNYPQRLKACSDGPILLYSKGNANLNAKRSIAVVGTRHASEYGQEICNDIISDFIGSEILVVSGLAYGVDACSHRSAIKNNLSTVGVLGHGLDRIYPSQHRDLSEQMLQNGGLLTEFRQGVIPDRQNFPMRNRIVAGMTDATLVVESKARGGSLITAYLAFNYNRDVFAIPGRPKDKNAIGCNNLIRNNVAQLVLSSNDIKKALNWVENETLNSVQKKLFVDLDENEQKVVDVMSFDTDIQIDKISIDCGLSMSKTAVVLLNLEFKGVVRTLPGKQYRKI